MMVSPSGAKAKLNVGAQLRTFAYPMVSKSSLSSNLALINLTILPPSSAWPSLYSV